jgi:RNase P subunit RPR2
MASLRYHYHCEQCEATWLTEAEVDAKIEAKIEAVMDCRFCGAQDIFSYRSDGGRIGRANLRTKLAVVEGAGKSKTPARAGKLKRSA